MNTSYNLLPPGVEGCGPGLHLSLLQVVPAPGRGVPYVRPQTGGGVLKTLGKETATVVRGVQADGPATDAGLRQGDIIQEVNRRPAHSVELLREALRQNGQRPLLLLVSGEGDNVFVTVRPRQ